MSTETFGQALRRLRTARGLSLADLGKLVNYDRRTIWDFEQGRRIPVPDAVEALDRALGAAGHLVQLAAATTMKAPSIPGLPDWADSERLAAGINGTAAPDTSMRDYLAQALALQRGAEDTAGAAVVLTPTLGQFTAVDALRAAAEGPLHRDLLSLEAQYAQFLGWLHQDLGDRGASEQWYARALMLAHEAGDDNMIASILSMRSNAAWGAGDLRRAVDLGEAAGRPRNATPGVLAFSRQQAARAYAATGDHREAEVALDDAARLSECASRDPEREPPWVYFLDEARVELQRALVLRELGRYDRAAELFRRALRRLPAQYRRDRGQNLARLALTLALAGEREEASAVADEARLLASQTHSDRTSAELAQVDDVLRRKLVTD